MNQGRANGGPTNHAKNTRTTKQGNHDVKTKRRPTVRQKRTTGLPIVRMAQYNPDIQQHLSRPCWRIDTAARTRQHEQDREGRREKGQWHGGKTNGGWRPNKHNLSHSKGRNIGVNNFPSLLHTTYFWNLISTRSPVSSTIYLQTVVDTGVECSGVCTFFFFFFFILRVVGKKKIEAPPLPSFK